MITEPMQNEYSHLNFNMETNGNDEQLNNELNTNTKVENIIIDTNIDNNNGQNSKN